MLNKTSHAGKETENKYVLKREQKTGRVVADVTSVGRLFHKRLLVTGKARSPTVTSLVDGTTRALKNIGHWRTQQVPIQMSSSYSSLDLFLSHSAHFAMGRFICVYLCVFCVFFMLHIFCIIMSAVEWTWWDWSLILRTYLSSLFWHCLLGHSTHKNLSPICPILFDGTLNLTQLWLTKALFACTL